MPLYFPTPRRCERSDATQWFYALALLIPLLIVTTQSARADPCQTTTMALDEMETREIQLIRQGGKTIPLQVKVARKPEHRAAGFQHICADTIAKTAILFLFQRSSRQGFHMQNVHAALDIAFISDDGVIREIQTMRPYVLGSASHPQIWHSETAVSAALEVAAGYFSEIGVKTGDKVLGSEPNTF